MENPQFISKKYPQMTIYNHIYFKKKILVFPDSFKIRINDDDAVSCCRCDMGVGVREGGGFRDAPRI